MNSLQKILAVVMIQEHQTTQKILQNQKMFAQLCQFVNPAQDSLIQFEEQLKGPCGLSPRIISGIVNKLSLNTQFKTAFGKKILFLWFKYKIFEAMDILSQQSKAEAMVQKIVARAMYNFWLEGSSELSVLLRKCLDAIAIDQKELPSIMNNVMQGRQADINQLFKPNKRVVKTVIGIDATGSMGMALKKTCSIVITALQRAYFVINKFRIDGQIQIKVIAYRNYNSPFQQILETSAYESKPEVLCRFLQSITPSGGWGNEAIQLVFQALNKEEGKIDQVILIGDAGPNTPTEVTTKRAARGENYWNSTRCALTNIEKELDQFVLRKCPVHSFYINAGPAFSNISNKTGGEAIPLNLSSDKVIEELSAFVAERILKMVEAQSGNQELVKTYKSLYTI